MRIKFKVAATSIAAVAALALTACGGSSGGGSGSGDSGSASSEPIHLGEISATTGATGPFGEAITNGAKLAVDEVNAAGGVNGRKIQMDHEDDGGDKAQAIALFKRYAGDSSIVGVIGPNLTTSAIAVTPIADQLKMPMLADGSTGAWTVDFGKYVFRLPPQASDSAKYIADKGITAYKPKKLVILYATDAEYSVTENQAVTDVAKKASVDVSSISYKLADNDYSSQITQLKSSKPDMVFLSGTPGNMGPFLLQAKNAGYTGVKYIGDGGLYNEQLISLSQGAAEGVVAVTPFDPTSSDTKVTKFISAYTAKFNAAPTGNSAYGYDSVMLTVEALKSIKGDITRDKLRDALAKSELVGVTGKVSFPDGSGNSARSTFGAVQVVSGKFTTWSGK